MGNRLPLIYVAGPYSAPTQQLVDENVNIARAWAELIWNCGGVAICPHLNTQGFEKPGAMREGSSEWRSDFAMFLSGDFEIISRCDGVYFIDGWEQSKGAVAEFAFAKYMGYPCFFTMQDVMKFIDEY